MKPTLNNQSRRAVGTAGMLLPLLAIFGVAYVLPLVNLVASSFMDVNGLTFASYLGELSSRSFGAIMVRTIWLSVVVTGLCILLAYPVAYSISRLKGQAATALLLVVSIPYFTSILIRTYAWIVVLSPNGVVNQLLRRLDLTSAPIPLVFNNIGVYVGMVQVQLPLMIFPLYAVMSRIDRSYTAAAVNLGSSPAGAFWNVFVPLSMPGVVGGATLVFLSCLGFYVTPALLGGPGNYMLSQGISLRVLRLADFGGAATQATLLLALVVTLFVLLRKRIAAELVDTPATLGGTSAKGLRRSTVAGEFLARRFAPIGRVFGNVLTIVRRPLLALITTLVLLYLIVPLLVVIPLAFSDAAYLTFPPPGYSLRWFDSFFSNRQWVEATWFSLKVGGIAAIASLLVGVPAAFAIVRRPMVFRVPLYLLMISPLVVPQVVVAVALYFSLAKARLVGTEISFVLAYMLLGVPYVVVVFISGLRRFDRGLEIAASSLGANAVSVLRTVTFPLLIPTIASALLFAFIVAFDDVVFGLFLSGRQATPLPMRMMDNLRLEISPQIAVVAVLLFSALAAVYLTQLGLSLTITRRRNSQGKNSNGR